MQEQQSLESFKKQVEECLLMSSSITYVKERMKLYEDEFPQFLKDNWTPGEVAAALIMGY